MKLSEIIHKHCKPIPPPPMRTPGILNKKEDGSFEYQIINEWQLCPKCLGSGLSYTTMTSTERKELDRTDGRGRFKT